MMRRLLAIALVAGCAASSQAQRVAPIGATTQFANLDSARAPQPSSTIDDDRRGSVWKWVAIGTVVGAVVGGYSMKSYCSNHPTSCAEFSTPLGTVLGGIGGGVLGALTFQLYHARPGEISGRLAAPVAPLPREAP
jgi:hypothetical protein